MLTKAVNAARTKQLVWEEAKSKAAKAGLVIAVCASPACTHIGVLTLNSGTKLPDGVKALSRCSACKEIAYCCRKCQVLLACPCIACLPAHVLPACLAHVLICSAWRLM